MAPKSGVTGVMSWNIERCKSLSSGRYGIMQIAALIVVLALMVEPARGQISTACTTSMLLSSFTPCMNFLTGSSNNGGSPTSQCCQSLASLISSGTDCGCLIVTGNVPVQLPINRTLAISLPRVCSMPSVPLRCRASATPLPAPGPVSFGPGLPPRAPTPEVVTESPVVAPDTPIEEPAAPAPAVGLTPVNPGVRPVIQPSLADKLPATLALPVILILMGLLSM